MARGKTRRTSGNKRRSVRSLFRLPKLIRSETVGAAIVVLVVALLPYLLPLTSVLRSARDELVSALGVHVFTALLMLMVFGVLLAFHRAAWLLRRRRHLMGMALLLVFSAGALGLWKPSTSVGGVDLAVTSAGGDSGRFLTGSWLAGTLWLSTLPLSFSLLWPRTALRLLRATPGELVRDSLWIWRHGPRQLVAATVTRAKRFGDMQDSESSRDPYFDLRAPMPTPAKPPEEPVATVDDPVVNAETVSDAEEDETPARQMPMDLEHEANSWRHSTDGWQLPPIEVLAEVDSPTPELADRDRRAELIVETLASFGVEASVTQVNEGPTVTQFGVEPGWDIRTRTVTERSLDGATILDSDGQPRTKQIEVSRTRIRVSRITSLQNDLALALAAPALRIEAPVPGKSVVGIEVPNAHTSVVTLRGVLESREFVKSAAKSRLPFALGTGVAGSPVIADLAEMPHLLIAGATGAGKSVCLNSIIACFLMNYSPEQLRLVMVDPKRVELAAFADVPHLAFSEIVVDMDKVVGTLQAVIHEMESRYRQFAKLGVRNLERYNESAETHSLPYWVVFIDELADLMLAAPYQVEHQLVRLAQLARATGIHLVVATQRPSVDVVTGLIKANFPTRIAFAVASQVDSRTVLDSGGAEKLLGRGDMLYQPKDQQKPTRLQGVYVSDEEIAGLVGFWANDRFENLRPDSYDDLLKEAAEAAEELQPGSDSLDVDPMITKALELAREHDQLSTSLLQRRLRIGYPRAARVMDELEEQGVVGSPDGGSGARPVLLDESSVATPPKLGATGDES